MVAAVYLNVLIPLDGNNSCGFVQPIGHQFFAELFLLDNRMQKFAANAAEDQALQPQNEAERQKRKFFIPCILPSWG